LVPIRPPDNIVDIDVAGRTDLRAGREQDTIGIDDEDLAIGPQRAENLTGVLADHAVKRNGVRGWLRKRNLGIAADIETLPVNDRLAAALLDGHDAAVGADRDLTGRAPLSVAPLGPAHARRYWS
jgi:hypothetical protein